MFNSEALEVGIGMAFLFLLMALICSGIKEWIEGMLKWRAMDLERAMRTLFNDESGQLSAHLFAHPLISSLYRGTYDPAKLVNSDLQRLMGSVKGAMHMPLRARRSLPSYIPSDQFAKALIDIVGRGPVTADAENTAGEPLSVEQLRKRAAALASPFLQRVILCAIDHGDGSLQQVTENLQHWFDGSMDRASGWYKRRTQAVLFVLGLGAAILLNVDALYVMGRLTEDKALREAVVSAAAHMPEPPSQAGAAPTGLQAAVQAREELGKIGMPMGWVEDTSAQLHVKPVQSCKLTATGPCGGNADYSSLRLFAGWLVTAFAVMLGAPFWFDILNKFMVIRSTVKPGEKSGDTSKSAPTKDNAAPGLANAQTPDGNANPAANAATPAPAPEATFVPHQWRTGYTNEQEIPL